MTTKCIIFIWSCKHTFKVELCCHKSSRITCQNCLLFLQWQKLLELQLILFVALQSALLQSRGKCLLQQNGRHFWQQKLFRAFVKTNKIVDPNLFCSTQWQNLCQKKHALCNDKMLLQQLLNCGSSHQWHPCQTYWQKWHPKRFHCHWLDYGQDVQLQLNVWNCFHQSGLFIIEVTCVTWQRLNPIHWSLYADNTWMVEDTTLYAFKHTQETAGHVNS